LLEAAFLLPLLAQLIIGLGDELARFIARPFRAVLL
jgi:hypothetical protein